MNDKKVLLTTDGLRKLEDELAHLKTVRRKDVAEKIKEARGQGDLSENAEYDAAKEEQGNIETRIALLEKMLRNAEVIEDSGGADEIGFGTHFTLSYTEDGERIEEDYLIVGSAEADPFANPIKISNESPLGAALIGKKAGEDVEVEIPGGVMSYKVESLKNV